MSQLFAWWPKYWSFSFSIIPSKEIPELISFRIDWLDLFAVQGTLIVLNLRFLTHKYRMSGTATVFSGSIRHFKQSD